MNLNIVFSVKKIVLAVTLGRSHHLSGPQLKFELDYLCCLQI